MARLNAQYNVAAPDSLPVRLAGHMRRRMFERFLADCRPAPTDTVLDIGVTADRTYDHSNYLEAWYPHKERITAVGLDDASFLEQVYPGLHFVQGDGRALPFADRSFDFVHSSAVLEHVGSRAQQTRLVAEALRVARRGAFLTTPNRWFPVEFHSVLPLVHWLPKRAFRAILRRLGHTALAEEANLNLLTRGELAAICRLLGVADFRLDAVSLAGWPTNLILTARLG